MLNLGFVENYQGGKMVLYPRAKINIGLYVTEKRKDGYHNIRSMFYPLKFCDILEFVPRKDEGAGQDELTITGMDIPGDPSENLILKACNEMRKISELPFFRIHLHKIIPTGAGLGGGSSDGSAMLNAIQKYSNPKPSGDQLRELALTLGSDCPFFLNPVSSFAYGRGEVLKSSEVSLEGYWISVFNPGIHVATAEAYQEVELGKPEIPIECSLNQPVETWRDTVKNVFEPIVFKLHPEIRTIKDELYKGGALYASMTGSGSSVFGIFKEQRAWAGLLGKYHIWTGQI